MKKFTLSDTIPPFDCKRCYYDSRLSLNRDLGQERFRKSLGADSPLRIITTTVWTYGVYCTGS